MGDVFIIFILLQFGAGPALITYWIDTAVAISANVLRRSGFELKGKTYVHRWIFNFSCCAISTYAMYAAFTVIGRLSLPYPLNLISSLFGVAIAWFLVNTGTLSLALSFWKDTSFFSIWREGIALYVLNFLGSAAAAGLISVFYKQAGFLVFFLSVPIAVILYQLYHFY